MGRFCLVTGSLTDITRALIRLHGIYTLEKTCCCWVKGFVCVSVLEKYVSHSLAAGRAADVEQVLRNLLQKRKVPWSSRLGVRADNPKCTKRLTVRNLKMC